MRKIVKIVAYYDDGTYQEIGNNSPIPAAVAGGYVCPICKQTHGTGIQCPRLSATASPSISLWDLQVGAK